MRIKALKVVETARKALSADTEATLELEADNDDEFSIEIKLDEFN